METVGIIVGTIVFIFAAVVGTFLFVVWAIPKLLDGGYPSKEEQGETIVWLNEHIDAVIRCKLIDDEVGALQHRELIDQILWSIW